MIANRIKELRKEKGLTQKQLSEVTGLGYKAIANYEIGFREPNSKAMAALEDYFQVSGKYLRGETDERTIPEAKQVNKYKKSVNQEISKRIKLLRKERGITQRQMSEKSDINYISIVNYENGCREPNSKAMVKLENFFQVSGAYLRGETDERMPKLEKHSNNNQFDRTELDLLYNLVHKEIMCAERLSDIYDLSGKANEDVKAELLKLAVKINEMKEYGNERV
ncbi:Helix-turn-helix [[Clostridium] innocuum]|uniref:helix-turn-helix domain-containing protein n=1 Tax=Clostridium innocuum TaxID=1522 RepID=UPI0008ED8135|nr:helix-turn-helix transcriptional regulator [[Clostridium] innocuum]SFL61925.1 Helix-turn-helix [[Clostridium] innocuum]